MYKISIFSYNCIDSKNVVVSDLKKGGYM